MSTCQEYVEALHLFNSCLAFVLRTVCHFWMEKSKKLSLYTTNVINKHWKITDQFLYFLFVEKFLNDCYIMKCMNFLLKVTWHPWHISVIWWRLQNKRVIFDISKVFDKFWHEWTETKCYIWQSFKSCHRLLKWWKIKNCFKGPNFSMDTCESWNSSRI